MAQQAEAQTLKRTPLHDAHLALGAKMVPFAGYEMPVHYPSGMTAEHRGVRTACGLFDVSHMGEFIVRGERAVEFANAVATNDVAALAVGQAHYSSLLNERGTFEDDCLVYRADDHLMIVVNASNSAKDLAHITPHAAGFGCTVEDVSARTALLALQGPDAPEVLRRFTEVELDRIAYYHFTRGTVAGIPDVLISRTGYTGEDGFELYLDGEHAPNVWSALLADGSVTPAGLGARDSLRLEMGMALYGNDIDDTVTPYEANLAWIVKLKKGDFVGRDALVTQKEAGIPRKLVGFVIDERAFPRHGYNVYYKGEQSGVVCSGTVGPSVNMAIGTCYLPTEGAAEGTTFEIAMRGKRVAARVVKPPFYKKASHR